MRNPCKECEDRHHNCHSHCDEYKAFSAERNRINTARYQANMLDHELSKSKVKNYCKKIKRGER